MNNVVGLVLVCQCCDKYFVICKSCYRGHKYCSLDCKLTGYESRRKTARQKFENTFEEKLDHADRQARYRERQKVTDKSSKLNIKNVNLHSLRHTYATSMLTAGVSITTLKEMLGHKSIHMTLLYAKVTPEKIHAEYSEAIKKMNSQQIPHLFTNNSSNSSELFKELSRLVQKKIDQTDSVDKIKKLQLIQSRIAKLKMDFTSNLLPSEGKG